MKTDGKDIWVFTPSRTSPEILEAILVQRHDLLTDAVERVRESVLTAHKHHLLFVGPRGCGKTHLVSLIVSRLLADGELTDAMRLAWLNEDETSSTLLDLLLRIHAALQNRYPEEYRPDQLAAAYDLPSQAAQDFVARQLLDALAARTLVVATENLDQLLQGLGDSGQKELRAFIQENPRLSIVATAQRLVEELSDRIKPFFGFFQTEHLKPLNVDEATQVLRNIARQNQETGVEEFLATSRGRARVKALHHLSGGNHRIYIVLSKSITRDSIDALVGPFMQMVDELTPYYQERIRWLPPLQRRIVECLCNSEGTMPVKEIAKRLFATPQTISSQLQALREKGYVEANQRGRESLYEVSEPLLRICVEVKDNQRHQPLRLLVDFLRVWYDDQEDSECAILIPPCPRKVAAISPIGLAEMDFRAGKWSEGFERIEACLEKDGQSDPPVNENASNLSRAVFSAGLDPENRAGKVNELLGIYQKHQALAALGEAVVQHIGSVFQAGAPFPSADNLDGWASAWEEAAMAVPDFRLSVRLLRIGVEFIKAGGSRGVLLDLTSPERAILEQAFGLTEDKTPKA